MYVCIGVITVDLCRNGRIKSNFLFPRYRSRHRINRTTCKAVLTQIVTDYARQCIFILFSRLFFRSWSHYFTVLAVRCKRGKRKVSTWVVSSTIFAVWKHLVWENTSSWLCCLDPGSFFVTKVVTASTLTQSMSSTLWASCPCWSSRWGRSLSWCGKGGAGNPGWHGPENIKHFKFYFREYDLLYTWSGYTCCLNRMSLLSNSAERRRDCWKWTLSSWLPWRSRKGLRLNKD